MPLEPLKQRIASRSFWSTGSEDLLLPRKNLVRPDYLSKLAALEEVNVVTSIMGQRRCGKSVVGRLWADFLHLVRWVCHHAGLLQLSA